MEQEESDIDKHFRKKLQDYEKSPSKMVWENIQQNLNESPKKNQNKVQLRHYFAIAASVALLITIGSVLYKTPFESSSPTLSKTELKKDTIQKIFPEQDKENKIPPVASKPLAETKLPSEKTAKKSELITVSTTDKKTEFYLPDSSKISLNKNSAITYNSDFINNREVEISNGEAYFEVRKKDKLRFTVKGNLSVTEVLGTSFMVRSYKSKNEDEIYVASGKVTVSHLNSASQKTYLLPNEKCVIKNEGTQTLEKIKEENYSAWKSEEIVFRNTELNTVARTLEEYYGVRLQINNPEILTCRFTGRFEKSSLHEVLQVLTATFNLSFNDRQGVYTLSGKGCK